ncbi:alpha/beta hydrolase [Anaerospora sp.]|uniref:alpha/beta fold hydrolase n=1 Tax=Anaerospora sp. TaxID=1960278 RepID=UPI00289C5B29|nr:alpha/beta hydrolase [Anaerospora sp.]
MECKIKDLSINYEIIGQGKPVIMIHGYYPDHRLMAGCMEPIFAKKTGYKRIYIDLPGMGKTKAADWIINSDVMLEIVMAFIQKVIPGERFLLVGQSYGGYLSRGIIYKMGSLVDGLFLLCPCVVADSTKRTTPAHIVLKRDDALLSQIDLSDAEEFNAMQVVQSKRIWERYSDEILAGVKIADDKFLSQLQRTGYEFSFNVDTLAERFNKPTLMLLGLQDATVGYKDAWNMLDNYPRAAFAVLDRAGHNLQLEQEAVFNCLVNEWLTRIEEA